MNIELINQNVGLRILCSVFCILCSVLCGCEESQQANADFPAGTIQKACLFTPQKIKFNQLTQFTQSWQIAAYIDVFDQFDSRIKTGGVWRFELYEKVPRSADPMGGRVFIWPDFELTEAKKNNDLWQEYLHCYKFELNMEAEIAAGKTYILQAVYFSAAGKRITDSIELKP